MPAEAGASEVVQRASERDSIAGFDRKIAHLDVEFEETREPSGETIDVARRAGRERERRHHLEPDHVLGEARDCRRGVLRSKCCDPIIDKLADFGFSAAHWCELPAVMPMLTRPFLACCS